MLAFTRTHARTHAHTHNTKQHNTYVDELAVSELYDCYNHTAHFHYNYIYRWPLVPLHHYINRSIDNVHSPWGHSELREPNTSYMALE